MAYGTKPDATDLHPITSASRAARPFAQPLGPRRSQNIDLLQVHTVSDETFHINRVIGELKLEAMRVFIASNSHSDRLQRSKTSLRQLWPSIVSPKGEKLWLPQPLSSNYPHPPQSVSNKKEVADKEEEEESSKAVESTTSALMRVAI